MNPLYHWLNLFSKLQTLISSIIPQNFIIYTSALLTSYILSFACLKLIIDLYSMFDFFGLTLGDSWDSFRLHVVIDHSHCCIFHYMNVPQFIHSITYEHLGGFQLLAVTSALLLCLYLYLGPIYKLSCTYILKNMWVYAFDGVPRSGIDGFQGI